MLGDAVRDGLVDHASWAAILGMRKGQVNAHEKALEVLAGGAYNLAQ